jgi:hypothetical protein
MNKTAFYTGVFLERFSKTGLGGDFELIDFWLGDEFEEGEIDPEAPEEDDESVDGAYFAVMKSRRDGDIQLWRSYYDDDGAPDHMGSLRFLRYAVIRAIGSGDGTLRG